MMSKNYQKKTKKITSQAFGGAPRKGPLSSPGVRWPWSGPGALGL